MIVDHHRENFDFVDLTLMWECFWFFFEFLNETKPRQFTGASLVFAMCCAYFFSFFRIVSISSITRFIFLIVSSHGSDVVISTPAFLSNAIG